MSLTQLLSIGLVLAICAGPVPLLRRAGPPAPPALTRKTWIPSPPRVSLFPGLLGGGMEGVIWPAVTAAAGLGAGLYLLGALRPLAVGAAPTTLHAFLAQVCGGSAALRRITAAFSVAALLGLAGAEAAALAAMAAPLTGHGAAWFAASAAAAGLCAVAAGPEGARYVAQALLGAVLVGLLGAATFLLYLSASDLHPMPPHGAFALVALAASCLALLAYRQTKYIETPHLLAPEERSRSRRLAARQVRLAQRFANVAISVLAVLVVMLVGLELYFLGPTDILGSALAAFGTAPRVPAGCLSIALMAVAYPLADAASWRNAGDLAARAPDSFRPPMRMVAGETAMMGIAAAALGALAALSTDLLPDAGGLPDLVRQLILLDNEISDAALTLLLVGCFAMAAATMVMTISAALATVTLDILPALETGSETGGPEPAARAAVVVTAAGGLVAGAVWLASGIPSAGVLDERFLALALAFASLQTSLLPLLLARFRGLALPGPGAALGVVAAGAAAALGTVAIHAATADALWLWLAPPASLLSGLLPLAVLARRRAVTPGE